MALNSSGPISFGGSTTGQSINLELGVSATAQADINSTAFRTLAGVSSGAISLNNFYGKSNVNSWVLYLGTAKSTNGTSTAIGTPIINSFWTAGRNSGAVAISVAATATASTQFGIKWISSTGSTVGTYNFDPVQPTFTANLRLSPCYSVGTDYFHVQRGTDLANIVAANGSSYVWGSSWKNVSGSVYVDYRSGMPMCTDSSGNVSIVGQVSTKYSLYLLAAKWTNAGTQIGSAAQRSAGDYGLQYVLSIYPRSDGTTVAFGASGSSAANTGYAFIYAASMPSSTAITAGYSIVNSGGAGSGWASVTTFDQVNNIAYTSGYTSATGSIGLARFDATFTCTAFRGYSISGWNMINGSPSISYWNGAVYMFGVNTSSNYGLLVKLDPTTLVPVWGATYTFTGGSVSTPQIGYSNINLYATAGGNYFTIILNTNDMYLFNIDGSTAPASKVVSVPYASGTLTLTVAPVTVTSNNVGLWGNGTVPFANGGSTTISTSLGSTVSSVTNGVTTTLTTL